MMNVFSKSDISHTVAYKAQMNRKSQANPYRPLPDSEQITNPARIIQILARLTKHYTPVKVQIPGHKVHYNSGIVNVDEKQVLLDELLPNTGHQLLVTEGTLQVTGNYNGTVFQFFTSLEAVDDMGKIITYHTKLPALLEYRQRRQDFRVPIPMSKKLHVIIDNGCNEVVKGELHDLSHGGAGIIYLTETTSMEAARRYECSIELPDSDLIYCTVELRYSKDLSAKHTKSIGVQFIGLSPLQEQIIGHCIIELERDLIRKRARL